MPARLNPYILYRGQAREAAQFYQSVLGGELTLSTFGEFGATSDPAAKDQIMHGQLETDHGFTLMVSDVLPGMGDYQEGTRISVSLSGDDPVLRDFFEKLSEGGTVHTPLAKQMWGDEYGDFTDKYGVRWMVDLGVEGQ